ncbi:hypothetical protein [Castellaniella caeni]|uniref:hypothetical protein n=1 Tax=Castellaniella caeni TaxID=266123 RepID=UPI000836757D|nr:hypothetical protein [Castellaniella caeni]
MTTIKEGSLTFQFDAGVGASKYDDWLFYRRQFQNKCCSDNKAVDFLCQADNISWLVEVKDYRQHSRTKPTELANEVARKVRDTLAGLVAAQFNATETEEKKMAHKMLRASCMRIVCHLEQPSRASRLRPQGHAIEPDKLQWQLRQQLKAIDPHPLVVDAASIGHRLPWAVI